MSKLIEYQHSNGSFALNLNNSVHPISDEIAKYIQDLEYDAGENNISWTEQLLQTDPYIANIISQLENV
ncbi:MAG: hypothetical protein HQL46_10805 [Gammaproteobacteria bacterium]|nr:hypothetical protein [Gammaproteobacteria bacterium]